MNRKLDIVQKLMNDTIDESILIYVDDAIKCLTDTDEIAIAIYIKLAELFWYSPSFIVDNDYELIEDLHEISVENNDVVCFHWAIIYSKLLDKYGIENDLTGDEGHLNVKVKFKKIITMADATKYGAEGRDYLLADLTNAKLGLKITGISTYCSEKNKELNEIIDRVYDKLQIKAYSTERLDRVLSKYRYYTYKRMNSKKKAGLTILDGDEIHKRIHFLNHFYRFKYNAYIHEVERMQFFSKYYKNVFEGFNFDNSRCITLCEETNGDKHLIKLLVLQDDYGEIYYFLETDNGYIEYNKKDLLDELDERKIWFRYEMYGVLGFSPNEIGIRRKV